MNLSPDDINRLNESIADDNEKISTHRTGQDFQNHQIKMKFKTDFLKHVESKMTNQQKQKEVEPRSKTKPLGIEAEYAKLPKRSQNYPTDSVEEIAQNMTALI